MFAEPTGEFTRITEIIGLAQELELPVRNVRLWLREEYPNLADLMTVWVPLEEVGLRVRGMAPGAEPAEWFLSHRFARKIKIGENVSYLWDLDRSLAANLLEKMGGTPLEGG